MKTTEITVANVNQVDITIIKNGEKRVAVRPICDALGIDFSAQLQRLKRDEILSSTVVTITTVGADKKGREMVTIPFKFVFGWLFTIDTSKVREDAKDAVLNYKLQCYDALYNYFTRHEEFLEHRQSLIDARLAEYDAARSDFRVAKEKVNEARKALDEARAITEAEYFENKRQMVIDFPAEQGKEAGNE
jgi:hypothetical protein